MPRTALVWFRRDLRLADNEALATALESADRIVPVFLLPREGSGPRRSVTGQAQWLAHSLPRLEAALRARGSRLIVREGDAVESLTLLARECGASSVHCSREWSPAGLEEERLAEHALRRIRVDLVAAKGAYLVDPDAIAPASGGASYRVFAPFHRAWERLLPGSAPLPAPEHIPGPAEWPSSGPLPTPSANAPDPTGEWTPGEDGAHARLATYVTQRLASYAETRDRPDVDGTSRLSPHLAFGEVSPRQVVAAVEEGPVGDESAGPFLRQLAWREFSAHVVHHYPKMQTEPLRPEFTAMPWHDDPGLLERWRTGATGYPLVDAGMRQLAATGWMHNRVRMVAASLLTKHLLLPWQAGLEHFAAALTDHQVPVNVFNWQWVAGSGADAAPYFRIFNPTLQASRHDPDGAYIRRWVPELAGLPTRWVARPWEMPVDEARRSGLVIGEGYPAPIVDHTEAYRRAMAAYAAIKG